MKNNGTKKDSLLDDDLDDLINDISSHTGFGDTGSTAKVQQQFKYEVPSF